MVSREKYLLRLIADFIVLTFCYYFTRALFPLYAEHFFSVRNIGMLGFLLTAWYFSAKFIRLYDSFLSRSLSREFTLLLQMLILFSLAVISAFFFVSRDPEYSKSFVLSFAGILALFLSIEKFLIHKFYGSIITKRKNIPLMIVGSGKLGIDFYDSFIANGDHGYKLVGFVDDTHRENLTGKYLGCTTDLNQLLHKYDDIEDVIIALPGNETEKIKHVVKISEQHAKRVRIVPDFHSITKDAQFSYIGGTPLLSPRRVFLDDSELRIFKRMFDIIFASAILLFVFSWLFPIIAFLIKISSKGPIFFKQQRWGVHKIPFTCYKFRTMITESKDVNKNGKYEQATKNDPRVTKIGKFLRKSSLDELPQIINVLAGSMSIVGPRPHPIPLNIESKEKIDDYMIRHLVKPGITGWAQVNGFRGETKDQALMEARVQHDIWYIEHWSFWLDLQIIIQTVINIFKGEKNAY